MKVRRGGGVKKKKKKQGGHGLGVGGPKTGGHGRGGGGDQIYVWSKNAVDDKIRREDTAFGVGTAPGCTWRMSFPAPGPHPASSARVPPPSFGSC